MERTFLITISSQTNRPWHGTLHAEDGPVPFHSEKELYQELTRRLKDGRDDGKIRYFPGYFGDNSNL